MGKTIIITLILALVFGGGWYAGIGAWISNATGDVVDGISDAVGGDGCETQECRDLVAVIREYGSKDQRCHAGLIPRMFVSEQPIWSKLTRAGEAWNSEWESRLGEHIGAAMLGWDVADDFQRQLEAQEAEAEYIHAERDKVNDACRASTGGLYWG